MSRSKYVAVMTICCIISVTAAVMAFPLQSEDGAITIHGASFCDDGLALEFSTREDIQIMSSDRGAYLLGMYLVDSDRVVYDWSGAEVFEDVSGRVNRAVYVFPIPDHPIREVRARWLNRSWSIAWTRPEISNTTATIRLVGVTISDHTVEAGLRRSSGIDLVRLTIVLEISNRGTDDLLISPDDFFLTDMTDHSFPLVGDTVHLGGLNRTGYLLISTPMTRLDAFRIDRLTYKPIRRSLDLSGWF